jgi:hypothetical protein
MHRICLAAHIDAKRQRKNGTPRVPSHRKAEASAQNASERLAEASERDIARTRVSHVHTVTPLIAFDPHSRGFGENEVSHEKKQ